MPDGGTNRFQILPREIGKCSLNDCFEMQGIFYGNAGFEHKYELLLVFDFGSDSEDFDQELL